MVEAIKQFEGTHILVAHRSETIRMADIIYQIVDGQAIQVAPQASGEKSSNVPTPSDREDNEATAVLASGKRKLIIQQRR